MKTFTALPLVLIFHIAISLTLNAFATEEEYTTVTETTETPGYWTPPKTIIKIKKIPLKTQEIERVSGKNLIFIAPKKSNIKSSQKRLLESWGSACPGDSRALKERAQLNKVFAFNGNPAEPGENLSDGFNRAVERIQPYAVILSYDNDGIPFSAEQWAQTLNSIPQKTGCLLIPPGATRNNETNKSYNSQLRNIIAEANHSCQVVSNVEELEELKEKSEDPCRRFHAVDGKVENCAQKAWMESLRTSICNTDTRAYVNSPAPTTSARKELEVGN